jgi:glucokinase
MAQLALGVDIGGTKILTALVDDRGQVIRTWRMPTLAERGGPAVMKDVEVSIETAMNDLSVPERAALAGLGVCAAGQVDFDEGEIAYASPNIPGWTGTPVRAILEKRFGMPVTVDNDANAAAFGEWWAGAGRGCVDMVMVTVGTGVGGGIVQAGKVLRGGRWRGGEIGHMVINADGIRCNCGQPGCLEMFASGTAIARMAAEARPGWTPSTPEVFAAAEAGDAEAEAVLVRSARYLAIGLVSLSSLLDADCFLLGGGVSTQPSFLPRIQKALTDSSITGERPFDTSLVKLAALRENAGAVGAAGELFHALKQKKLEALLGQNQEGRSDIKDFYRR